MKKKKTSHVSLCCCKIVYRIVLGLTNNISVCLAQKSGDYYSHFLSSRLYTFSLLLTQLWYLFCS